MLREPSRDALTAACIVGETRSLIFPVVQRRLREGLLRPMRADAFVVLAKSQPGSEWTAISAQRGAAAEHGLVATRLDAVTLDESETNVTFGTTLKR